MIFLKGNENQTLSKGSSSVQSKIRKHIGIYQLLVVYFCLESLNLKNESFFCEKNIS